MTITKQELLDHLDNLSKTDPTFYNEVISKYSAPAPSQVKPDLATALNNLSLGNPLKKYEKGDDFVTFCKRFKDHVNLTQMDPSRQLPTFMQHIGDDSLYNQLDSVSLNPDQSLNCELFITEFKQSVFGDDSFYLKNILLDCSQKPSESIRDYADRLRQKATAACPKNPNLADEMCLLAFIRGIADPRIKLSLNREPFASFSTAVKAAKNEERAFQVCNPSESSTHDPYPLLRQREFTDYDEMPRSSHEYRAHSRSRSRNPQSRNYSRDERFRSQTNHSSEDF